MASEQARGGERKVNVNDALDSTRHPNYSKFFFTFPSLESIHFDKSNRGCKFQRWNSDNKNSLTKIFTLSGVF